MRGNFGFNKHYQSCIRRRVVVGLSSLPQYKDKKDAEECMLAVYVVSVMLIW
jgi:hypothetical protein